EVLVSAVCLAALAMVTVASVDFSSRRSRLTQQRAVVLAILQQESQYLAGLAENASVTAGTTNWTLTDSAIGGNISLSRVITLQSGSTTLFDVTFTATWTQGQTQTLTLPSTVYCPNTVTTLGTYTVNPKGTFAAVNANSTYTPAPSSVTGTRPATVIDLAAAGASAGTTIVLKRLGAITGGPAYGMVGCFSTSNTQRTDGNTPQIPGATDAAMAGLSADPYYASLSNTIANEYPSQSFVIGQANDINHDQVSVTVPTGALYLFVASADNGDWSDNAANSTFQVQMSKVTKSYMGSGSGSTYVIADSTNEWGDEGEYNWTYGYYVSSNAASVTATTYNRQHRMDDPTQTSYSGFNTHQQDAYNDDPVTWANRSSYNQVTNIVLSPENQNGTVNDGTPTRRWTSNRAYTNVVVSGTVQRLTGTSTLVVVAKNVTTSLWSATLSTTSQQSFSINVGTVNAGDSIEIRASGNHYSPVQYTFQITGT
ncbi:MAG: hypothetical protein ABUL72_01250, partial [Armatimonadota bacterium]